MPQYKYVSFHFCFCSFGHPASSRLLPATSIARPWLQVLQALQGLFRIRAKPAAVQLNILQQLWGKISWTLPQLLPSRHRSPMQQQLPLCLYLQLWHQSQRSQAWCGPTVTL